MVHSILHSNTKEKLKASLVPRSIGILEYVTSPIGFVRWTFNNSLQCHVILFGAQETFLIFINAENNCSALYFGENRDRSGFFDEQKLQKNSIY